MLVMQQCSACGRIGSASLSPLAKSHWMLGYVNRDLLAGFASGATARSGGNQLLTMPIVGQDATVAESLLKNTLLIAAFFPLLVSLIQHESL